MTEPILWRCIVTSRLVHAFEGADNREALCGRKVRGKWHWTMPQADAKRCQDCEMVLRYQGVKA